MPWSGLTDSSAPALQPLLLPRVFWAGVCRLCRSRLVRLVAKSYKQSGWKCISNAVIVINLLVGAPSCCDGLLLPPLIGGAL